MSRKQSACRESIVRKYLALLERKDLEQGDKTAGAKALNRALHAIQQGHKKEANRLIDQALAVLLRE